MGRSGDRIFGNTCLRSKKPRNKIAVPARGGDDHGKNIQGRHPFQIGLQSADLILFFIDNQRSLARRVCAGGIPNISANWSGGGQGSGGLEGKFMVNKSPCRSTDNKPLLV